MKQRRHVWLSEVLFCTNGVRNILRRADEFSVLPRVFNALERRGCSVSSATEVSWSTEKIFVILVSSTVSM